MLFSSSVFIFAFFPIVLALYFLIKNRTYRNFILCLFSLVFYAWGEPKYVLLMLFSIGFNYALALLMSKFKRKKKIIFIIDVIINIALLVFFKYWDFGILSINNIFNTNIPLANIALPIGISFYTFQIMSYVIDVYRGEVAVQKNILKLATYISLFPQLIAGPIVRYETIEDELTNRKETFNDFVIGLQRFILGFGKKIIIANNMALIADTIYSKPMDSLGTGLVWIAAIAYAFQIYFDFSGYSDMAIGMGRMFGFKFLENFNYPYVATSIQGFWRRWHISLSTWFRDYVYIPLGGNRCSKAKWIRNLIIVWFLTGLWHGASWNFVVWGLYYCLLLILEKTLLKNFWNDIPKVLGWILTMLLVLIGWIIFRIENLNDALVLISRLFVYKSSDWSGVLFNNFDLMVSIPYILLALLISFPFINNYLEKFKKKNFFCEGIVYVLCLIVFLISISMLLSSSYNPFIYFRF